MERIFRGDDCSNLKLVAFVAKIACEGGPKTISTCLEMITVISLSFCHISERQKKNVQSS